MSHFLRTSTLLLAICVFATINFVQFVAGQPTTPAESEALVKLRTIIKDDELNLDYMKQDLYLLSWLRKHDFDVDTTATKIREAHQWRKDNKVDNILNEDFSIFMKNYPFDIEGVDREGRPVWFSQVGKWDLRRIQLSGQQNKYNRYRLYLSELIGKKMREKNENHPDQINYGFLIVVDLGGFNLRQHGCILCLQDSMKFDQATLAAYPDKPYKNVMINAPRAFEAFYRTIKALTERSLGDIEIYDFDQQKWQQVLLGYIAPDQLPTQYGGTRKTNLL